MSVANLKTKIFRGIAVPKKGGGPPAGYTWTTDESGAQVYTEEGLPVFDNGFSTYVMRAA